MDRSPTSKVDSCRVRRIPIYHPDHIRETKPDYVVILPWNLKDEIMKQLQLYPRVGRALCRADPQG